MVNLTRIFPPNDTHDKPFDYCDLFPTICTTFVEKKNNTKQRNIFYTGSPSSAYIKAEQGPNKDLGLGKQMLALT